MVHWIDDQIPVVQILQSVHAFSYNELKIATNGFRASNKIGEGGFGAVYKVITLTDHLCK